MIDGRKLEPPKPRGRLTRTVDWLLAREAPTEQSAALSNQMQAQISDFWAQLRGAGGFSPRLFDNLWAANRCVQLNAQTISRMPLVFTGSGTPPAWVSNPDPAWFPNGIGDAMHAAVANYYRHGDVVLYVTATYNDGYPSAWTVLDAGRVSVRLENGQRAFKYGDQPLDAARVVQITRNPEPGALRGTSALAAYSPVAWGSIATNDLAIALSGSGGGIPWAVLKSKLPITPIQSQEVQESWVAARLRAGSTGVPAVLPPHIDLEQLQFSPKDMMLLDSQQMNVRIIASAFGTPLFLLNQALEGTLVYQNPETLGEYWWRTELQAVCANIAGALSAQMLARGNQVSFDPSRLLASMDSDVHVAPELPAANASPAQQQNASVLPLRPMEVMA